MNNNVQKLRTKVLEAQKSSDIASLYVLEQKAQETFDEETLQGYYANILDIALEKLTDTLEDHRQLDMSNVQDFATTRALYEYAMEHYSTGQIKDASSLFEVLSGITNDEKFSSALKFHWIASLENLSLDDFIENIADLDATQSAGTFYIGKFKKEAQNLLDNAQTKGE